MNNQELIEAYIKGELEGPALLEVEKKISSDPSFASEVAEHKVAQEIIHINGLLQTREKLNRIREAKLKEGKNWKQLKWFMGGAVLVACLAGSFFIQINNSGLVSKSREEGQNPILNVERKDGIFKIDKPEGQADASNDTSIKAIVKPQLRDHRFIAIVEDKLLQKDSVRSNSFNDPSPSQQKAEVVEPKSITKDISSKDNGRILHKGLQIDSTNIPLDPCYGIVINATVKTEKSCEDNPTGKLYAMAVQGGKEPYSFYLIGQSANGVSTTMNYFDNLPAGNYDLTVKDQNGCSRVFKAEVFSMICNSKKNIFAPEYGESWTYPIKSGSTCVIRIFDSSGAQVFMINIKNGNPAIWDGRDSNFAPLIAGAYIYQVIYEDGSVDQGSVTIVR